jgi:type II secretory pathway pseudopilin PulG
MLQLQPKRRTSKAGASLIELLVVLAVMAILMSLILVAIQRSREAARRAVCQSNLHQISVAMRRFVELKKRLPDPAPMGEVGGWTVELLPFLEENNLASRFSTNPSLSQMHIRLLVRERPAIFTCPSAFEGDSDTKAIPATHYAMELFYGRNYAGSGAASRTDRIQLENWKFGDVTLDCRLPWVVGPELPLWNLYVDQGRRSPHGSGFNYTRAYSEGVEFLVPRDQ